MILTLIFSVWWINHIALYEFSEVGAENRWLWWLMSFTAIVGVALTEFLFLGMLMWGNVG